MDYIREAGWPVFPVLALAGTALVVALRYAQAPQKGMLSLVVGFGVAALLMSLLGTALGIDATVEGISKVEPERRWIFLIGLKESLRNLEVALALLVPTSLLAMAGAYRQRAG